MLHGTNEDKTSIEINNNSNSPISSVYPTVPTARRKKSQTVPEFASKNLNLNSFFNPDISRQSSPFEIGFAVSWRLALVVGVAYAIVPVSMGLVNAFTPTLYAAGVSFTVGAGGKFVHEQYQECTKTRKGPSSSV